MITMTLTEPFTFFDFDEPSGYPKGVAGTVEIPAGTHELERRINRMGHKTPWLFLPGTQKGMAPVVLLDWARGEHPVVTLRERVRVLSLWQPWATLWAIGAKRIETRGWATKYRGEVYVHATQGVPASDRDWAREFQDSDLVRQAFHRTCRTPATLLDTWGEMFPTGKILGRTTLLDCRSTDVRSEWEVLGVKLPLPPGPHTLEYPFGDYRPGRWMWLTDGAQPLAVPVPARGHQKLWTLERDLAQTDDWRWAA